jgi:Leucine-rich repeat (LRR) protein
MVYSLRVLDLSDTGISSASCLAGHGISRLYLANNKLTDVTFLSSMGSLMTVDISGNDLKTLSLAGQGSLTELNASDNGITSVTLGGDMTYLTRIDLRDNDINYLNIAAASGVSELYLDNNDLDSAAFITPLKSLRVLSLSGNDIMSVPSLKEHKITHLYLTDLPISSLSFMAGVDTFVELDLFGTDLVNISGLEGKTALRTLKIRVNDVEDLSVFETLQGVTDLSVFGTNDDFWPLLLNPNMQSLERLCITRSKITYAAITGLENLKTVEIITCRTLTDLSRIHNLPALETLYVEAVDVYNPYVSEFANLKFLSIIDGHVEKVANISDLPKCEYLNLSKNTTLDEFGFSVLPSLKTLILSGCAISNTDLKKLDVVINMGTLDLSKNSITKLTDFPFEADELVSLNLSNNKISSFSPIYGLEIAEVIASGNKGTYAPDGEE